MDTWSSRCLGWCDSFITVHKTSADCIRTLSCDYIYIVMSWNRQCMIYMSPWDNETSQAVDATATLAWFPLAFWLLLQHSNLWQLMTTQTRIMFHKTFTWTKTGSCCNVAFLSLSKLLSAQYFGEYCSKNKAKVCYQKHLYFNIDIDIENTKIYDGLFHYFNANMSINCIVFNENLHWA